MKLYLHIGTMKTGSTTLQRTLLENLHPLSRQGVALPTLLGERVTPRLFCHAAGNPRVVEYHRQTGAHLPQDVTIPSLEEAKDDLLRAFGKIREDVCVLSWEGFPVFFPETEDVQRLADMLKAVCDEIEIIVYLRRQDALWASLYGELLFQGRLDDKTDYRFSYDSVEGLFGFGETGSNLDLFDYERMLQPWAEVFGVENVSVRPFEREQLTDGDVVRDFVSLIGCDAAKMNPFENANVSMDRFQMEFLRRILRHVPESIDGKYNKAFERLGRIVHDNIPRTSAYTVPTTGAKEFLDRFSDSNARIAQEYLGRQTGELFKVSAPEDNSADLPELTLDKAMEIAGALWNAQWDYTQECDRLNRALRESLNRRASTLQAANQALFGLTLLAQGKEEAARKMFAGIPDFENRGDIREHLFDSYAVRDAEALANHVRLCTPPLSIERSLETVAKSPAKRVLSEMPKPERVLVFRSAPLFPSEDLFDHLFQVWPDVCADLVVQDGCTLGDGLPFASRLRIKPVPFTAEDFFDRHDPDELSGRYDLCIVPVNGEPAGFGQHFKVVDALKCPTCLVYRSWNLVLQEDRKMFELWAI